MELGTLQIQIFVSLVVVLGTAFVAFLCDFLKGNNEQLRERNIEMRVRQDERDRMGVMHPAALLKGIERLIMSAQGLRQDSPGGATPAYQTAPPVSAAPAAAPAAARTATPDESGAELPPSWEQPVAAPAAVSSAWASKEELEKLAERAARIRERHEARKASEEAAEEASTPQAPSREAAAVEAPAPVEVMQPRTAAVAEPFGEEPAAATAGVGDEPAAGEVVEPAPVEVFAVEQPRAEEAPVEAAASAGDALGQEQAPGPSPVEALMLELAQSGPQTADQATYAVYQALAESTATGDEAAVASEPQAALAESPDTSGESVPELAQEALPAAHETLSGAAHETPPPLSQEAGELAASVEAEATPVFEPAQEESVQHEAVQEAIAEAAPEAAPEAVPEAAQEAAAPEIEPAAAERQPELQPHAVEDIQPFGTLQQGPVVTSEEPAAIASEGEPVMKPMGTASIVPASAEGLLSQESELPAVAPEPEFMRVRVLPIDVNVPERMEIAEQPAAEPDQFAAESVAEGSAEPYLLEGSRLLPAPVEKAQPEQGEFEQAEPEHAELEHAEVEQHEPEPISTLEDELAGGAAISTLQESLVLEEPGIPPGFHPAAILRDRIKANAPFQGVSVSIGINDYDVLQQKLDTPGGADSLAAIEKMIHGMLKEPDFACRFQDDEYILLFPGEADSSAQRRLFQISEKLWDFQLRSLGHHSIMFSWGGLEVKHDSLSDAVAAARERMFQTKRNRTGAIEMRKRVVNG